MMTDLTLIDGPLSGRVVRVGRTLGDTYDIAERDNGKLTLFRYRVRRRESDGRLEGRFVTQFKDG